MQLRAWKKVRLTMPELPELETIRRQLENHILKKSITQVDIFRPKTINIAPEEMQHLLAGSCIVSVFRRAKNIILQLNNDRSLIFHFMLDGYLRYYLQDEKLSGSPQLVLHFQSGEKLAFFRMQLGYIHLFLANEVEYVKEISQLGPDPLSSAFTKEAFFNLLAGKRGMVKPMLIDQKNVAGIGNVYSNEILFASGLLPTRKIVSLQLEEKNLLYSSIGTVLSEAVAKGGVFEYPFMTGDAFTGGYSPYLKVYDRTGQPCSQCGSTIETSVVGGRNSYYCTTCQD